MDWNKLNFGTFSIKQVLEAVKDEGWQKIRKSMKGTSLAERWKILRKHLRDRNNSRRAKIQVTNYVKALARGGMIPPLKKKEEK